MGKYIPEILKVVQSFADEISKINSAEESQEAQQKVIETPVLESPVVSPQESIEIPVEESEATRQQNVIETPVEESQTANQQEIGISTLEEPVKDEPNQNIETSDSKITRVIPQYLDDIFRLLHFSILNGEYVLVPEIKIELEEVKKALAPLNLAIFTYPVEIQAVCLHFTKATELACDLYLQFIHFVENKFSDSSVDHMFNFVNEHHQSLKNAKLPEDFLSRYELLERNIGLAKFDVANSSEDNRIIQLFAIDQNIEEFDLPTAKDIISLIKLKSDFLKHKWKIRKLETGLEDVSYSHEGRTMYFKDFVPQESKFKEWVSYIDIHYERNTDWKAKLAGCVKTIKDETPDKLNDLELHTLIKYYKDVEEDYERLESLKDKILEKFSHRGVTFYDKYASKVFCNYATNNTYSLFVKVSKDLNAIRDKFKEAKRATKGSMLNFFLPYKYLYNTVDKLLQKSQSLDNLEFLDISQEVFDDHCHKVLAQYTKAKDWAYDHHNYIVILSYEDSTITLDEPLTYKANPDCNLEEIFIASSIVLPAVRKDIENKYQAVKQKFNELEIFINTVRRLRSDLRKINSLKDKMAGQEKRSIEIIGLFTAIMTFVIGSIPAFKFVTTFYQALLFLFCLGGTLGLFVVMIFQVSGNYAKKHGAIVLKILGWFLAMAIASLALMTVRDYKAVDKEIQLRVKSELKKLDSINQVKTNIKESLLKPNNNLPPQTTVKEIRPQ